MRKGVWINKDRVAYLLALYSLSREEFLRAISRGLKRPLAWGDVYRDTVPLHVLKRVDSVFQKGLLYYSDPVTPAPHGWASIFFRKETFGAELNLGAKRRVAEFEALKVRLNTIARLSDVPLPRRLPSLTLSQDPRAEAHALRGGLLPPFTAKKQDFLKRFINRLGASNVFVFEFVDAPNRREKANIDGAYLHPNAIVLQRKQAALSREIFTLAHELGHYLLDSEEAEEVDDAALPDGAAPGVEGWCNAFAFQLLLGAEGARLLDSVGFCDASNAYGRALVEEISSATHLSRLAVYTHLLLQKKIARSSYQAVRDEMEAQWELRQQERAVQRAQRKAQGEEIRGRVPGPITPELVRDIYSVALSAGTIGEPEYCRAMKVRPIDAK